MLTSSRMKLPIPSENRDPWYEEFLALINGIDGSLYAGREDRNIILMKGGTFYFNASTNFLSWSSVIEFNSPITGFLTGVLAGSVTIPDGYYLVADIVRAPTQNPTVTAYSAAVAAPTDNAVVIAMRRGNKIYFRNGKILQDGQSINILESTGTMGTSGQVLRSSITLASGQQTAQLVPTVACSYSISPADYAISGATQSIYFMVVGSVSGGMTLRVQLYNLSDASAVTAIDYTETMPTRKMPSALTLPSAEKVYEVRYWLLSGTGSEIGVLGWAGLQINNTFI